MKTERAVEIARNATNEQELSMVDKNLKINVHPSAHKLLFIFRKRQKPAT